MEVNSSMNGQNDNAVNEMFDNTLINIDADIAATANAVPSNTQPVGTNNGALQLDGLVENPQQNNSIIDPWHNQTLPQRTFENATVSPDAAWHGYRPVSYTHLTLPTKRIV